MVGAKKAAKARNEKAAQLKAQGGHSEDGPRKGGNQRQAPKQKQDIVPWGWEQAAKEDRKQKIAERQQAEAAAKAAKEMKDLGIDAQPKVKKQPDAPKDDKAAAGKEAAKAAAAAAAKS